MLEADIVAHIEEQLQPRPPARLGVAVSGGSDSVALLCLLALVAERLNITLLVISVDHGLRAEARTEIRTVTDLCARLGVVHHVEYWSGWDGGGNLQNAAREARYSLISDWAIGNDITTVALGHTANDQAETFMMRLARGSGVDGLAAMAPRRVQNGVTWVRPLLGIHRRTLRNYLRERSIRWIEDPSNEDQIFERVRMRDALALLEPLGITVDGLTGIAQNMRKAREALDWQTFLAARDAVIVEFGTIRIDMKRYRTLPEEIARRLIVRAIGWISQSAYSPRRASVSVVMQAVRSGDSATLEGVQLQQQDGQMWLFREYAAVSDQGVEVGDIWDDRWTISGPEDDPAIHVRAVGPEGLKQVPNWREAGLPRAALLSTPGVWLGEELISAPVLGWGSDWSAEIDGGADAFYATLLSH